MIKQALLDLDGVVTNFVKAVCNIHNRVDPYTNPKNFGLFDMDKIWGMTVSEFWAPLGYDFWATLELMDDAQKTLNLLDGLIGLENVCLLTAPAATKGCLEGKKDWVSKNLPAFRKRLLIGACKEFCSGPNRLLIDDRDSNIDKYAGPTYLVPRPWNRGHAIDNWHLELERMFL